LFFVVNICTLPTTTTLIQTADLKENNQRGVFHFPQISDTRIPTFQAGACWGTFPKPAVHTVSFSDISIIFICKAFQLVYQVDQLPKSQHAKLENKSVALPPKTLRFAAALTKLIFTILNTKFLTVFTLDIPSEKKTKKHQFVHIR